MSFIQILKDSIQTRLIKYKNFLLHLITWFQLVSAKIVNDLLFFSWNFPLAHKNLF